MLQQRFRFYKQVNSAPLAYYFARCKQAADSGYAVPYFLVLWTGPVGGAK
jgi:hypothetical protein